MAAEPRNGHRDQRMTRAGTVNQYTLIRVPADVERAIDEAGARDRWEPLTPADRRRKVYAVKSACTAPTRERRVDALLHDLCGHVRSPRT
jgi:uncharacterized protein YdeI (YjbR/CyaY-like superfamily)